MQNSDLVKERIYEFLSNTEPGILCIRGSWGVGKTFSWKECYVDSVEQCKVQLKRYSYVSLFGINSLESLKAATFENIQIAADGKSQTFVDAIVHGTNSALSTGAKYLGNALQAAADLGGLSALGSAGSSLLFASVREQIICIDDLERAGNDLSVRDVMGYITFMKEERNCKVVLLLNDRQLKGEAAEQFTQDFEKVVDQAIVLSPQPNDVATIVLGTRRPLLAVKVSELGITNFRVIKKIERALQLCEGVLAEFDPEVHDQAATSMAVLGWSLYRAEGAPPIGYLRGLTVRNQSLAINGSSDRVASTDQETRWDATLETYQFDHMDEFDEALLRTMEFGFCDPTLLRPAASLKEQEILKRRGQTKINDAWNLFHASFSNNQDEVVKSFSNAIREYGDLIPLDGIVQIASLFWSLDLREESKKLVMSYKESIGEYTQQNDDDYIVRRYVEDGELAEFISDTFRGSKVKYPPDLLSLFRSLEIGSWNDDHLNQLGALSVDDYVTLFESLVGDELTDIGRACLQWRNLSNPTDGMRAVQSKAERALREIGAKSLINKARLSKFGLRT